MPIAFGELGTEPDRSVPAGTVSNSAQKPAPVITVSSPTLDPMTHPGAWTRLVAAGVNSPGNIPLGGMSGWKREEKWDVKEGKGTTGATTTHVGQVPAKGSITFELWKVEHFAAWDRWLQLFRYDASKKIGQAISVYHPALAALQPPVTSVVMIGHTAPDPQPDGRSKVTIDLLEFFPAKATGASTAAGAKQYTSGRGNATGTQVDPAIAALQKQAAALAAQVQGTA
jgi:hypothetical protein